MPLLGSYLAQRSLRLPLRRLHPRLQRPHRHLLAVRHRQHLPHGTAKLPPITACPLEPTPRPFALLNDRARQRMRGASTLDVTTGCTTTDIQQSLRAAPRDPH